MNTKKKKPPINCEQFIDTISIPLSRALHRNRFFGFWVLSYKFMISLKIKKKNQNINIRTEMTGAWWYDLLMQLKIKFLEHQELLSKIQNILPTKFSELNTK
ncbi:zinc finger MYM-type protein 1-like [Aphis craccivora]|uniref:Zinc finger MYM-type protein 1-like n=1 Tax=Aphis craccivora TaxID=307492 RepID=A0A6G0Y3X6_APHCR|nr:zinc finger MYM-type protein 1-like [Aphis craccivora]